MYIFITMRLYIEQRQRKQEANVEVRCAQREEKKRNVQIQKRANRSINCS